VLAADVGAGEAVERWLKRHKRFHLHFTPTSSSWLNQVERWFRDLTDKNLRRGIFASGPDLIASIEDYLTVNNENPKPYVGPQPPSPSSPKSSEPAPHSTNGSNKTETDHYLGHGHGLGAADLEHPTRWVRVEHRPSDQPDHVVDADERDRRASD
jgi:hypothetical protein